MKTKQSNHSNEVDFKEATNEPTGDDTKSVQMEVKLEETSLMHSNDTIQLTSLTKSDVVGMEFDSVDNAEEFYQKYSEVIGFSVRKDELRRAHDGSLKLRHWVCFKQGYRPQKYVEQEFVPDHSHELAGTKEVHFLRSHRIVKESDVAHAKAMHYVGIKTGQIMDYLVDQASCYSNVGYLGKDLQNKLDANHHNSIVDSDAETAIGYFHAKAELDPPFDSTYVTNAYRKPLVIVIGTNHHRRTTVLGFGLLMDETTKTYTWLLETFLKSMNGKKPNSVITDGDKAMANRIKIVMPDCVHRLS
ncbi:hypothetical protein Dsin_022048 [Dipteronia sinensis]|uniref:Protein FAR1-RELATED SEQUENCE n=1 Tax=Dipteronia sinensis TaxID=43782 RepID=A0AAE0A119_9ROSI|nr:hypothetical protein Dsin_022048 [Dipteronia sinensis]